MKLDSDNGPRTFKGGRMNTFAKGVRVHVRHIARVALLVGTIGGIGVANSTNPREDFESPSVLSSAVTEIKRMNRDQLEALIDYIANCDQLSSIPEREFACERATTVLRVKTAQFLSLARIRHSLFVAGKVILNRPSGGTTERSLKDIERWVDIYSTMTGAASERYLQLSLATVPK
jgi:hypothetical protein